MSKLKIVVTADWHCHNWRDFSHTVNVTWDDHTARFKLGGSTPMNSRLFYVVSVLCDLREYCEEHDIKYVLCAGDVFHSRATLDVSVFNAVNEVVDSFRGSDIKIIFLAGNHDQVNNSENPENSLQAFRGYHKVVEQRDVINLDRQVEIVCVPYSKDAVANVKFIKHEAIRNRILLAHLGLSGGIVGSSNYVMTDEYNLGELRTDKYQFAVFGHYHKPQELTDNTIYCGSPLQNNFNDEGDDHGFWVLDTDEESMEFVPLDYPKFVTITDDTDISRVPSNSYVRVKTKAPELVKSLDTFEGARLEIEKDYQQVGNSKISVSMTEEQVIKQYIEENLPEDIDADRLLQMGMEIMQRAKGVN